MTMEKCKAIFKQFDTDSSGFITKENIIEAMHKLGQELTQEELEEIMIQHDKAKDGRLSFEEFRMMLIDENDTEECS